MSGLGTESVVEGDGQHVKHRVLGLGSAGVDFIAVVNRCRVWRMEHSMVRLVFQCVVRSTIAYLADSPSRLAYVVDSSLNADM